MSFAKQPFILWFWTSGSEPIKSFNCCFLLLRTTWSLPCRTSFLHFVLWWTHDVSSIIAHPHWTNCNMSDLYDGYFQTDETVRKHLPRIKVELILIQRDISVVSEYFLSNHWFVLAAIKIPTFLSSWSLPSTPSTENLLRWVDEILKRKSYENRKAKMKNKKKRTKLRSQVTKGLEERKSTTAPRIPTALPILSSPGGSRFCHCCHNNYYHHCLVLLSCPNDNLSKICW